MWAVMSIWDGPKTDHIDKKAIYSETQLEVLVNGHLSEWFQMTVDNRQGVDPSPRSFCFVPGENNGYNQELRKQWSKCSW